MTTLDDMLNELAPEDRAHVEARSKELIMEERALQTLRKAKKLSQARMAELLNMRQDSVSRLERRSDLLISTLRSYVEAMGGSLKLMVNFPGQPSLFLDSLDMKAVKTADKAVVSGAVGKCLMDHMQHRSPPVHLMWSEPKHVCPAPSGDSVAIVCFKAPDAYVRSGSELGFTVGATLGTPSMTYKAETSDAPWRVQHESA